MKRMLVVIFVLALISGVQYAQDNPSADKKYVFKYSVDEKAVSSIDNSNLQTHPFGDNIARKLYMVQDLYTYVEPATPTSPTEKTIVLKPVIYNSVLKLNRYYKKQVKNGIIEMVDATREMDHFLDIAISIAANETDSLEADLKKVPDLTGMIQVFSQVELIK